MIPNFSKMKWEASHRAAKVPGGARWQTPEGIPVKPLYGESDLKGTVDKDKVSFVENLDYQGQMLAITYTGQIVSADEIRFKRDVGGQGGEDFIAKRQK